MKRLREYRDTIVYLAILLLLCYNRWQRETFSNDLIVTAIQYNPTGYRLWTQFLVMLDQNPLAYVALTSIVFAFVSWALYLGCDKEDRTMLFVWLVFVISWSSNRQSPAFLLLALAVLFRNSKWSYLLVVPMVLVKEHAGLVYIIYLIAFKKYKEAVLVAVLWGVTYLSVRLIVGPLDFYMPDDPAYFVTTPILTLDPYLIRFFPILLNWKRWVWITAEIVLCLLFLERRTEVFMILANLPIIMIFGLFYEAQLWLMVMVVIVYKRKVDRNDFRSFVASEKIC